VDTIGAKLPGNDEETVLQPAPLRDHELWQQVTQHSAASPGGLGEIAESGRGLVVAVGVTGTRSPRRVIADIGDADEQIDVAHQLGEQHRWYPFERNRFAGAGGEAHLIGRKVQEPELPLCEGFFDRVDPELDL
jgi:hypothetical protein